MSTSISMPNLVQDVGRADNHRWFRKSEMPLDLVTTCDRPQANTAQNLWRASRHGRDLGFETLDKSSITLLIPVFLLLLLQMSTSGLSRYHVSPGELPSLLTPPLSMLVPGVLVELG